jgi:hypothetical protein
VGEDQHEPADHVEPIGLVIEGLGRHQRLLCR